MTPAEEAQFIRLWQEGASYKAIAQALGCPLGTVASRSATLAAQGKIHPRQRGGAYQRAKARPDNPPATPASPTAPALPASRVPPALPAPPATPAIERKEIQQWTVRLSKTLIEHLKAGGYERRIPPSQLVEELLWAALTDQQSSTT